VAQAAARIRLNLEESPARVQIALDFWKAIFVGSELDLFVLLFR